MKSLKSEIEEFQLNRRLSDNKNFTTLGLMDKVKGTPRYTTKKALRESAWNAVIFQQYEFQRDHAKRLHHGSHTTATRTNRDDEKEHADDVISNANSADDTRGTSDDEQSKILASAYHDTSHIAQTLAYQQALKVHREIQFDASMK